MKALLSRYRPTYLRSLVYMLQSSEYNVGEYLSWVHRTSDFSRVERRKRLVMTPKAQLLLTWLWLMVTATWVYLGALLLFGGIGLAAWLWWALVVSLLAPYSLAYGLAVPLLMGQVLIQRPRERAITSRAKRKLAAHPGTKIAIAGSFGKTSFKYMLAAVLAEGKKVAATPGNMNTPLGISRFVEKLTSDEEVLILELGEYYPGDIEKLCQLVQPDIGVITGVNEAHLLRFKTLDRTVGTIFELADYLGDKPTYVNGESELVKTAARGGHLVYTCEGVGSWRISQAQTGLDGTKFTAAKDKHKIKAQSGLLGLHQIGPMAACIDVAYRLGLSVQQIEQGLAKTKPFEHRLQPRPATDGVVTIDDSYNGNPTGVRVVIEFLGGLKGHRRWYVTPGLKEMGPSTVQVHQNIGKQLAAAEIEKVILIRNSVTSFIAAGLNEGGFRGELIWFDDALTCFAALPNLTVTGDVVLLQNDWADQYA
ncbi:MAG TPA: UDP-N-acetylmuramoyl-tripeptide--D-alanyl-D-alanine ligase [Candidatus Saccharimonadales bacterium]|nr:UDP-N-acetylmuramoyl-tripeptide--D-alanyl-D-alanine ligase [Candidatus Saccharimonadales bacterium]